MPSHILPRATYRLQFHKGFTFRDALDLVPYLDALGISHVYASPIFLAAPGSLHGYDVYDHNQFNPEIGTADDFDALSRALVKAGMSILLDFVPNHMGISGMENHWWADVLEKGEKSPYACYFDIDWKPFKAGSANQVLLPILADQYGRVLESGTLRLIWREGVILADYLGMRLPLCFPSILPLLEKAIADMDAPAVQKEELLAGLKAYGSNETDHDPGVDIRQRLAHWGREGMPLQAAICGELELLQADFDRLDALFSQQHYRLSHWKVATEEINYRRFFDVNSLASLRMEEPRVFADSHGLLLELIRKGAVSGVRIDHVDGLALPQAYLGQLQGAAAATGGRPGDTRGTWLVVEKILGSGETLPSEWPVHGTTGYEFTSVLTGLLVDPAGEKIITAGYEKLAGRRRDYSEEAYLGKRLVMQVSMGGEINTLGHLLNRISAQHRWYRDFTLNALTTAVREVIACFPVYRSYLNPGSAIAETDRRSIMRAIVLARRRNAGLDRSIFDFLHDILLRPHGNPPPVNEELRTRFVLKFQQTTGPVMAKGVEDTAFYVYNRLIALNEVGSNPGQFGCSVEEFHLANQSRLGKHPLSLLATSTHDTKRGEDVRARLVALSQMPRKWIALARRWLLLNQRHRSEIAGEFAPDSNEQYLLYQTLLGSWPLEPMDDSARASYVSRIQKYMLKAVHEAKANSSWLDPNEAWDEAVSDFVARILKPGPRNLFLTEIEQTVETLAYAGMVNSLAQTALKLTSPGIPDIYQGTEIWDWSLVDPDNRRPVDYTRRREMLESGVACEDLLSGWRDGRIKLHLLREILGLRRRQPDLFIAGDYLPVKITGSQKMQAVAFLRRHQQHALLVVVPRINHHPAWDDTRLEGIDPKGWTNILTGAKVESPLLVDILSSFPVAVCTPVT